MKKCAYESTTGSRGRTATEELKRFVGQWRAFIASRGVRAVATPLAPGRVHPTAMLSSVSLSLSPTHTPLGGPLGDGPSRGAFLFVWGGFALRAGAGFGCLMYLSLFLSLSFSLDALSGRLLTLADSVCVREWSLYMIMIPRRRCEDDLQSSFERSAQLERRIRILFLWFVQMIVRCKIAAIGMWKCCKLHITLRIL